jgi:hypothetical protein
VQQEQIGFAYYSMDNVMQLFRVFDFYWLLVILGAFALRKSKILQSEKHEIYALLWAFILSLLFMPIWPYIVDRILFMVAPTLVVFAVLSEYYLKKLLLPVIVIGGSLNISVAWLIYKYNISGILLWGLMVYALVLILAFLYARKFRSKIFVGK